MKATYVSAVVSLARLFALAGADITLNPFPDVVHVGETYTLTWTATANYTYTVWLIINDDSDNAYEWTKVTSLGASLEFESLNVSYEWTVPSKISLESLYGLWLNGFTIPFNGASYTTQTNWFRATNSSQSPGSSGGVTPSATHSARPSTAASEASHSDKSLSGGATAGIVIGCLLAAGIIIGAALLFAHRRRRAGIERREAAARANRLEPVMQDNFPGYEMQPRTSRALWGRHSVTSEMRYVGGVADVS
ncbi:uncharacterized protein HMPREF1541_03956 [Cyphellophora europaea CBS 101466]|uniref:Mid2 domain-containing protein n=1 Tax=Cyphellophora europaea (strain CBS 101466) TaxID=1220924 RepID=W2S008_CYPE1|nr:uncharacterized protein HMPREF1541_03956 [Cyphellophora europaea CBS 101466]ETN42017.1 hypothetical protein HMPREF1541_03956 [Cyphellophora europaea CBS 101466]